ncbi:hypothetical protein D3C86_681640 [compost metagenome]
MPLGDLGGADQRMHQPLAKLAAAHGRARLVQHPEQRALPGAVPGGLHQLQVAASAAIKSHVIREAKHANPREGRKLGLAGFVEVGEQRPDGSDGQRMLGEPEAFQAAHLEMLQDEALARFGGEAGLMPQGQVEAFRQDSHPAGIELIGRHPSRLTAPGRALPDVGRHGHQQLGGHQTREFRRERARIRDLGGEQLTGGNVAVRQAEAVGRRRDGRQEVVLLVGKVA